MTPIVFNPLARFYSDSYNSARYHDFRYLIGDFMIRLIKLCLGILLIGASMSTCGFMTLGPHGPAHYDYEFDGMYYRSELVCKYDDRVCGEKIVLVPAEAVNRPRVESPFWRFWDELGGVLFIPSILAFICGLGLLYSGIEQSKSSKAISGGS
jgi:hypothetical protein